MPNNPSTDQGEAPDARPVEHTTDHGQASRLVQGWIAEDRQLPPEADARPVPPPEELWERLAVQDRQMVELSVLAEERLKRAEVAEAEGQALRQEVKHHDAVLDCYVDEQQKQLRDLKKAEADLAVLRGRLRDLTELVQARITEDAPTDSSEYCWHCQADVNGKNGPRQEHETSCWLIRTKAALRDLQGDTPR